MNMHVNFGRMLPLVSIALVLTSAATLGHSEEGGVPPEFLACAPIRNSSERLACFDRAVATLRSGSSQAAAKPIAVPEAMFGINASAPAAEPAEAKVERSQVDAITATVTKISRGPQGVILVLDNDQTWQQTSGSSTLLLKTGDQIKITRGALNSFNLATPSGRIAKVRRVK